MEIKIIRFLKDNWINEYWEKYNDGNFRAIIVYIGDELGWLLPDGSFKLTPTRIFFKEKEEIITYDL